MTKMIVRPSRLQGFYLLLLLVILLGLLLYFVSNYNNAWLIATLTVLIPILFIKSYLEKKEREQASSILNQLTIEILDTGVIIFDMHSKDICCSIWIPNPGLSRLHGETFSTNAKYDANRPRIIDPDDHQAILMSIKQRAQVYEKGNGQPDYKLNHIFTKLEHNWDWRLITPVLDAVDRLRVIGILVIEGRNDCDMPDLNQNGLDKAAAMIASQVCEVLSVSHRMF